MHSLVGAAATFFFIVISLLNSSISIRLIYYVRWHFAIRCLPMISWICLANKPFDWFRENALPIQSE